jgi:hypothetical protein
MCAPCAPTEKIYKCLECEKAFTRSFNLRRHTVRVHKNSVNAELLTKGSNVEGPGSNVEGPGSNVDKHKCHKCHHNFSYNWCLTKHLLICKGDIKPFECKNCMKKFKTEKSRSKHCKKCDEKNKEGTVITTNIGTQNNINTQNNNNIATQNNIIIVYNPNGGTPFTSDHLTTEDFKKILKLASPNIDSRTMAEYSKQILSHPENRCIKKKDLKSGHSQVHTGDDNWELQLDKLVYPQLASDMANNMVEFINAKRAQLKKDVFDRLRDFVDYMADNGYINTNDVERQKEIQNEYKDFVKGLKLIVYGNPKTV